MRLAILVDVYPPEVSSAALLIEELAHGLAAAGDEVFVVTTFPQSYLAAGGEEQKAVQKVSREGSLTVIRARTLPLRKVNFVLRGISQLCLPFLIFRKVKKYVSGPLDGVVVYSPPLPLAIAGRLVKRKYHTRFMLNLWDIFPENAIDLGILNKDSLLGRIEISMFEALEKFAYRSADVLTFHAAKGMRFLIEKKHIPPEKISILPHWVDFTPYAKPLRRDFRREFGLERKFVFLFAGVIGPAQGLEFLVEVANGVRDIPEAVFLIVGDGTEKEKISGAAKERGLGSVIFKDFISKEDYPDLVKSVDAGVVCLSPKNKTPFVPGKFMGYMAAGKPVLAFLNKESDGFELVDKANCGFAAVAGDLPGAVKAARDMYALGEEKAKEAGQNGLTYARARLSLDSAVMTIRQLLKG